MSLLGWEIYKAIFFNPVVLISLFFPLFISISYNRLKTFVSSSTEGTNNWIKNIINTPHFDAILDHSIQLNILLLSVLLFFFQVLKEPFFILKDYKIVDVVAIIFNDWTSSLIMFSSSFFIVAFMIYFLGNKFSTADIFEDYKRAASDKKIWPPKNKITLFRAIVAILSVLFNLWLHNGIK